VQGLVWLQVSEVSAFNIFYIHTEWFLKQIHLRLLAIKILKAFWSFQNDFQDLSGQETQMNLCFQNEKKSTLH